MATKTTQGRVPKQEPDEPMKIAGKAYASVSELVRDTSDPEFSEEFDKHLAEHRLSKILTVIRCSKGSTQSEIAQKMGCGQAKVSKMERMADHELNFGDIVEYSRALDQALHVVFMTPMTSTVDHIRFHVNAIKHEIERLVDLGEDDQMIGDGVEAYAINNVEKYLTMIEEALERLPHRKQPARSPVCVEVEGERGERPTLDAPRRVRPQSRKAVPNP